MANPIAVLDKPQDRNIVVMILTMFDGKTVGEICDILDIVNFYVNYVAEIDYDDRIFSIDQIKTKLFEELKE